MRSVSPFTLRRRVIEKLDADDQKRRLSGKIEDFSRRLWGKYPWSVGLIRRYQRRIRHPAQSRMRRKRLILPTMRCLTPLISGNQITSRKPPSGLSSALTHHDAAEWRFQQLPAPNLYRQITIACFIGTIERTENLFAIFGLTPGPSSSTVMVIPSLSTASPLQSSYGNNAGHYEQCFPGTLQGVRVAVQRPRPRREVNVNDLPICSASNAALSSTSLQTGWL